MMLDPVCAAGKPLGPSWPSVQWWLSLTAADQGAWISGIGAFSAALAAVWVSGRERRRRDPERGKLARTTGQYLYADILRLANEATSAKLNIALLAEFASSDPYALNVSLIQGNLD